MGRSLLVIDDDKLVAAFIRGVAEDMGVTAATATDAREMDAAMSEPFPSDIVLDLQLGERDGIEVLRSLAEQGCRARITLLSGFDKRVLASARELASVLGLNIGSALTKPVRMAELREALTPAADAPAHIEAEHLAAAIGGRELFPMYQPIVCCASGEALSLEALARWQPPGGELISPARFIPLAENDPALMHDLTMSMAGQIAADSHRLRAAGFDLPIALNISARNLHQLDFPERLSAALETHGAAPDRVKLEVTETAAMADPLATHDVLLRLRLKGFTLAVDDFGTGYSSVSMLRRLPYSEVKVDRSFVALVTHSEDARAVVKATIALAHSMGLSTVAEGVATMPIFEAVRGLGAGAAQGYAIAHPMRLEQALPWLRQRAQASPSAPEH